PSIPSSALRPPVEKAVPPRVEDSLDALSPEVDHAEAPLAELVGQPAPLRVEALPRPGARVEAAVRELERRIRLHVGPALPPAIPPVLNGREEADAGRTGGVGEVRRPDEVGFLPQLGDPVE